MLSSYKTLCRIKIVSDDFGVIEATEVIKVLAWNYPDALEKTEDKIRQIQKEYPVKYEYKIIYGPVKAKEFDSYLANSIRTNNIKIEEKLL